MPVFVPVSLRGLPRAVVELIRLALFAAATSAAVFVAAASVRLWFSPAGTFLAMASVLLAAALVVMPLLALRLLLARAASPCDEMDGPRAHGAQWERLAQAATVAVERAERPDSVEQAVSREAVETFEGAEASEEEARAEGDAGSVEQQIERIREPSGRTVVLGWQRLDWEAKQRRAVAHVAFCPPLTRRPEVEVGTEGDTDATVHSVEAETYGVRIELRRSIRQAGHPASVRVFFSASEPEENVAGEADCDV